MYKTSEKSNNFVSYILKAIKYDIHKIKKADNEDLQFMAWEHLSKFIDLNNERDSCCYSLIAANIARSKRTSDTELSIGSVIKIIYKNENTAKQKLKRILDCDSSIEVCGWLKQLLHNAAEKNISINYARLLDDLIYFNDNVKKKWAMDFFKINKEEKDDSDNA
jgi:CRISPR system Cascade subunit CasB